MFHLKSLSVSGLVLVGLFLLAACSLGEEPTPEIVSPLSPPASPIKTPTSDSASTVTSFNIDEPLVPGDTRVSGVGPAGMEIAIVDVTLVNREIGTGTVDQDGTFDIEVSPPLSGGHRIGITIFVTLSEAEAQQIAGDGARFMGKEGWVYESAIVEPE